MLAEMEIDKFAVRDSSFIVGRNRLISAASTGYALCLDTTGSALTVGLSNFESVCRCRTWALGRALSTHLHSYLAEFIQPQTWSDLVWLAVAQGPGSFTGTRIGVVTARTIAQQLQLPLFALSILAAYAWAEVTLTPPEHGEAIVAVEMPGQRDAVHGGLYQVAPDRSEITVLICDQARPISEWESVLAAQPMVHRRIKTGETQIQAEDLGRALLALGHQQWQHGDRPPWQAALPHYG